MCGEWDGLFAGKPRSYKYRRDTCRSVACQRRGHQQHPKNYIPCCFINCS